MLSKKHINIIQSCLDPAVKMGTLEKEDLNEVINLIKKEINKPKKKKEELIKTKEACSS